MYRSLRILAVLVLFCAVNVISTSQNGSTRQSRLPHAPSLPQQSKFIDLPPLLKYASYSFSMPGTLLIHASGQQVCTIPLLIPGCTVLLSQKVSPCNSLTFVGSTHGLYRLSSYTEPSIQLIYLSSFMFACLADLFDAIANQNWWAHQAYPGGRYQCRYTYPFPHGHTTFTLVMVKVDAPNWDFTFSDIADDLSAIFNAAQFFESPRYGLPQMNIEVFRYRNGEAGPTFLASEGAFAFELSPTANLSVT